MSLTTTIVVICLAAAILLGLIAWLFRVDAPAEHRGWDADPAELDTILEEQRAGELPTVERDARLVLTFGEPVDPPDTGLTVADLPVMPSVEEWERRHAGEQLTRPDNAPARATEESVRLTVVPPPTSPDDTTLIFDTGYPSRHHADTVRPVDPDWYNAQLGCAQYPRAGAR